MEEVRATQLDNTNILSNCTVCLRALSKAGGAWYCDRCWRFPNLCSLCHQVVKGLFVWCQVSRIERSYSSPILFFAKKFLGMQTRTYSLTVTPQEFRKVSL